MNNKKTYGRMYRGIIGNGDARVLFCETTQMAAECAGIHHASPVAAAALGRGISAAALLSCATDKQDAHLTMTVKGGGPLGALVVVANNGSLKAYVDHPQQNLPLKKNGKLDVGKGIGNNGTITVVRDLGMREPYVGQCAIQSGEIAEDIAYYCTVSEQQPTLCALGVRVAEGKVISSGGLLVQPLPGCPEEILSQLELRAPVYEDISAHLLADTPENLLKLFFHGMNAEIMDVQPLIYECDCSRERMERVLYSVGKDEIQAMIRQDHGAEIVCSFCHTKHQFSENDLNQIILAHEKESEK